MGRRLAQAGNRRCRARWLVSTSGTRIWRLRGHIHLNATSSLLLRMRFCPRAAHGRVPIWHTFPIEIQMPTKSQHPETLALHAGYRSESTTTAVGVPIYQTTSYLFRDTPHAANSFGLAELGNIYARIMHPTNAVLEERVAALEGGVAGLALASGRPLCCMRSRASAQAGDNFVSSTDLYGGTWNCFSTR